MKNKVVKILLIILAVIVLVAGYFGITMYQEFTSTGSGTEEVVVIEIEQGETTKTIATKLKNSGLIDYEIVFYLKVKSLGVGDKLRYGTYSLHKESGLAEIIEALTTGGAMLESNMFTIPEGYTIELIAAKLEKEGFCTEQEFLDAVQKDYDYWFLEDIPINAEIPYKLQGFLYPETYAITDKMTAEDIVNVMLRQFDKEFSDELRSQMKKQGKTVFEVVVEASVIERETKLEFEKAMVAGVIENRIKKGMKLEIDATALYPLTSGLYNKNRVFFVDLEIDSLYNTYMYEGLPVGPICNPSISCMEAVLNPAQHSYLYYHTDKVRNDGSHIFTETYEEHVNTQ